MSTLMRCKPPLPSALWAAESMTRCSRIARSRLRSKPSIAGTPGIMDNAARRLRGACGRPDGLCVNAARANPATNGCSRVRNCVHHITDETSERLVFNELLVDLRVVLEQELH